MDTERSNGLEQVSLRFPSEIVPSPTLLPAPIGLGNVSHALLALLQDMEESLDGMLDRSNKLMAVFEEAESEAQIAIRMVEGRRRAIETQKQSHKTFKQSGVGPLLTVLCPGLMDFPAKLQAISDIKTTFYKRRNAR